MPGGRNSDFASGPIQRVRPPEEWWRMDPSPSPELESRNRGKAFLRRRRPTAAGSKRKAARASAGARLEPARNQPGAAAVEAKLPPARRPLRPAARAIDY